MRSLTSMLLFFFILTGVSAKEDKDYILRKKILEMNKNIEMYNQKSRDTETKTTEFRENHSKRILNRKNDISKLTKDISQLEKEFRTQKLKQKALKKSLKEYKLQFSLFRKRIIDDLTDYNKKIKDGLPYNIERRSQNITKLITDASFESISPEEIFNRYYNFLNKELIIGLDSEVYLKDNTKYLRIGRVIMAYSDDSANNVGILTWKDKSKWDWGMDLTFTMRKAIRDSIKMVEGKKAPELIDFPVPISYIKER